MADGPAENVHDDHGHDAPMQDHPDHDASEHGGEAAQDAPDGTDPSAEAEDDGHDDHGHGAHDDHDDDHGHGGHDDHGDHGPVDDKWVLAPIAVGLVIGLILAIIFGLASGAASFI